MHVKHAPAYVVLQNQGDESALTSSDLHNVLAAPLGLSTNVSISMSIIDKIYVLFVGMSSLRKSYVYSLFENDPFLSHLSSFYSRW